MNKHKSPTSAKPPLSQFRALCLFAGLSLAAAATGFAQVPAGLQKDFSTPRGIRMTWNPGGYWSSPVGVLKGSSSQIQESLAELNRSGKALNGLPAGFSYSAGTQRELILSNGKLGRSTLPPQAVPAPEAPVARAPAAAVPEPAPAGKVRFEDLPAKTNTAPAVPQPYVSRPAVKGKPVPLPPLPVERRLTAVEPAPRSVPKAVPFDPKAASPIATLPAPVKPSTRSGPKLVADALPATPIPLPAVKPAATEPSAPAGAEINGIPAAMQKSFLSRNKSVFMIFDKEKGSWTSSPGAVKDAEGADEWCKQATTVDRSYGRIPAGFSYHHLGGGQVQITKD